MWNTRLRIPASDGTREGAFGEVPPLNCGASHGIRFGSNLTWPYVSLGEMDPLTKAVPGERRATRKELSATPPK